MVCKFLDGGVIGVLYGVVVFVFISGVEWYYFNLDFYYVNGGGLFLDFGLYYLVVMVFCFGLVVCVVGMGCKCEIVCMIENGFCYGEMMLVEVDMYCLSLIEFESGVIG